MIKEYGLWQVRDGGLIDIWNDKWIPGLQNGTLEPMSVGGPNFPRKVKEWMRKENEDWNWEIIGRWIIEEQKKLIRRIPVSARGGRDRFVWTKERSGKYIVKSGFFFL